MPPFQVNDKSIENATHEVAAEHLKMAGNNVTLVVQQQVFNFI